MRYIHAKQALTENGWERDIQIDIAPDGRIACVGPKVSAPSHRVDLALPAPVNLHSHAFQRAMAGLTEARGPDPRDSFWTWRKLMYRFLEQLGPDHVEAIAALVFMEMLEAGYAGVAEFHYLHHDVGGKAYANLPEMAERIVAAAQTAGIGLTLLPVLYQFGGCDGRPLAGGQRRFGNDPERFAKLYDGSLAAAAGGHPDYISGVAPHSLRAVDPAGLDAAIALCPGGPIHMHLAEQLAEVEEVQTHLGARPAEWLLSSYPVDRRWCLIHCTQMNTDETGRLARSGAVAGLCPITESNLGDGIFNGTDFFAASGTVGFGSDSNVHISLFDELRTLEYSQRLRDRSRAALATQSRSTGRVVFDQAAKGGAQAAGRASGAITAGMQADIVGLATDNQWLCNRTGDAALDSLIFGGRGQDCITDVWSAGRHVVKEGRHSGRDAIIRKFNATIAKLGQDV
ncbi:MAG: formimidoylglutamate deiminase [Paracoccaceae bacterium]